MIKKIILISLVLSLFNINAFPQKLNKKLLGKLSYTQLPSNPLPANYKSYYIDAKGANNDLSRSNAIADKINIIGFNKSDYSNSQFSIIIEEFPFQQSEATENKKTKTKKVDGEERKFTLYYYTSKISYLYNLKIIDKNKNTIIEHKFAGFIAIMGSKSNSSSIAYEKYKEKSKTVSDGILPKQAENINNYINNNIGFPIKEYSVSIYLIKPKKYDYTEFNRATKFFTKGLEIVQNNENNTTEAENILIPAIETWTNTLKESDINNKKARINKKITCAALYNIASSYLICKNYQKAIEYFQKCKNINSNFSNTGSLMKLSKKMKKRIETNN